MPFKWRLKKTRSYEISSKNSFIVGVYLLNNSFLECTLNSDSTGQECLDSIAQRIELTQTSFFGLRYVTKKLQFHWVELDRPLKHQLDKHAKPSCHPHRLYFGVMFYVTAAHKIGDEVARHHYYFQLKNDIIDGRLPCSLEQAIRMAAFSLQVEFGDHDQQKLTAEYFNIKDYPLLPKNMTKDEGTYMDLLKEVMSAHASLVGVPSTRALLQYIKEAQLMDGYGCDYYVSKDESKKDLYLGTSFAGIFSRYLDGQPTVYYRWPEIARISQNKKMLEVDTSKSSVQFQMEDTDTAKYVCRQAQLQHKFYKSGRGNISGSMADVSLFENDILFQDNQQFYIMQMEANQELTQSQNSLVYQQDQRLPTNIGEVSQRLLPEDQCGQSQQSLDSVHSAHSALSEVQRHHGQGEVIINGSVYTVASFPQGSQAPLHVDPGFTNRATLLPAYRPSPDYESIMQHRVAQQTHPQETSQNLGNSQVYTHAEGIAYSQPEIRQAGLPPVFAEEGNYVNAAAIRSYNHTIYANVCHDGLSYFALRGSMGAGGERSTSLAVHPTYSSPELNVQPQGPEQFTSASTGQAGGESLVYHFRPPPPYPRSSSSTPDLAIQTPGPGSSQPDLICSPATHSATSLGGISVGSTGRADVGYVRRSNNRLGSESDKHHDVLSLTSSSGSDKNKALSGVQQSEDLPSSDAVADQDDTSSEHSYATFHAKDSDDSSDEFNRSKSTDTKSQIQIRMLGPKEAPPPSKTKEVATLRESFRRMMIARSGSMRGSRKSLRESSEPKTGMDSLNLITVSEQPSEIFNPHSIPASLVGITPDVLLAASDNTTDMQEILEKLGDPPPYPGTGTQGQASLPELVPPVASREPFRNITDLSQVVPAPKLGVTQVVVTSASSAVDTRQDDEEEENDPGLDSDTDSDSEMSGTVRRLNMGPLKMAAMNGLTLSRSMIMAFMNDESRAPKDERRKILESKISEGQAFIEFEEIPRRSPSLDCNVAKVSHNLPRNRFKDVLPYDATRVKLSARKDNPDGYINASHVKLTAAHNEWWFIATQAPLPNTTVDFWQMIWEQEVDVIAMLTAFQELGKEKCFVYWPQETGPQNAQKHGDFEIELQFVHDSLCYLTSGIMVRHLPTHKEKMVWHLQYTDWPDHGCPEDTYGFLGFLDEVESVSRLAESEEGSGKKAPTVIHCSAGVGRTGVVILTMVMKWCLEHNQSVDLPKALTGIRNQRMHMVQTLGQYQFIHNTLIQYLKNTRLI